MAWRAELKRDSISARPACAPTIDRKDLVDALTKLNESLGKAAKE